MVLKVPIYVKVNRKLHPEELKPLVDDLQLAMYGLLRKKKFNITKEKAEQEALRLLLELLESEIIPYSEALELLRTSK